MPRHLVKPGHQPSDGGVVTVEVSPSVRSQQAAVFTVMVLTLALVAGLLDRALDPPQTLAYIFWGSTQLVAVLIMVFLITDNGRTREGPVVLGLDRLGARPWWMANTGLFILMFTVVAAFWLHRWLPGHPQEMS
jgi:hypothetical protein